MDQALRRGIMEQFGHRIKAAHKIVYCQMHLTHRCQYSCDHCYHREIKGLDRDIPVDDAIDIIERLRIFAKKEGKLLRADFTGGDPVLYPELHTIAQYCCDKKIPYGLKCNPDFFISSSCEQIERTIPQCSGISLSLDGPKSFHDHIRGEGTFAKVIYAAHKINELDIFLRINATISRANQHILPGLLRDLYNSGITVDAFTWARFWSAGEENLMIPLQDLPEMFDGYMNSLEELYRDPQFFLNERGMSKPRINSLFKEHLWFPHLHLRGYIDKDFFEGARDIPNCLNCSATKSTFVVDSRSQIYRCRKNNRWKVELPPSQLSPFDFHDCGTCSGCLNRNVCLGCPSIAKEFSMAKEQCPYFESV